MKGDKPIMSCSPLCAEDDTRLPNLYADLCARETLVSATRSVFASLLRSPDDADAVDHIDQRLALFLDDLEAELNSYRYAPGAVLMGWRKCEGHLCRVRILSLKDRIVHTALFIVLEKALGISVAHGDLKDCQSERVLAAIHRIVLNGSSECDLLSIESSGETSNDLHLEFLRMFVRSVPDEELRELMRLFTRAPALAARNGLITQNYLE